jgi:3',5'-cyclic AMP phosphodiesterase CpdA
MDMTDWELTAATDKPHSPREKSPDAYCADTAPILIEGPGKSLPTQVPGHIRCVILSDMHGRHYSLPKPLPKRDVLLHLGDVADRGKLEHIQSFADFMKQQTSYPYKIVLEGNHDRDLQHPERIDLEKEYKGTGIILLRDDTFTCIVETGGTLTFYGAS